MPRNHRSIRSEFLRFIRRADSIEITWDPNGSRADGTPATTLDLSAAFPKPPFREQHTALRVTSHHHRLNPRDFSRSGDINDVEAKGHGRTLTALNRRGEPVAALAYHLDRDTSAPLLVTVIAVLDTRSTSEAERRWSVDCVTVLLASLSQAAERFGRPSHLGVVAPPHGEGAFEQYGFSRAGVPAAFGRPPGTYLTWTPR